MSASPPPVPRDVPEVQPDGRALRNWMNDLLRFLGSSGGTGTVTEIDTTAPITGGPITTSGTIGVSTMTGDSGAGGATGVVPAPAAGDAAAGKFLKASGTWAVPSAGATITTQDEGSTLSSTVNTLNFTGANVTASGAGATTTVAVAGVQSVASADGTVIVTNPTTTPDLSVNVAALSPVQVSLTMRVIKEIRWRNTANSDPMGILATPTGSLTTNSRGITYTDPLSIQSRANYLSAASINSAGGFIGSGGNVVRGNAAWGGGFTCFFSFGIELMNADSRFFAGLTAGGAVIGASEPSAAVGGIGAAGGFGIGQDAADTQLQMMGSAGAGVAATKTALGASFGRPANSDWYHLWIYCLANASAISVRLDKITTSGVTTYTGSMNAAIPPATSTMLWTSAVGTGPTTATASRLAVVSYYQEQYLP